MTRVGDGDTTSHGVGKAKRSMKKCEACRSRKIACLPRDRDWSERGVKEKCNTCNNLDLPCGPNVRMNAKVEIGPRKLASKNALEAVAIGPAASSGRGVSVSSDHRNDGDTLPPVAPSEPQVQVLTQAQNARLPALQETVISENQSPDIDMILESSPQRNVQILGAAATPHASYESMTVPKFGLSSASPRSVPPSIASNSAQYPASVRSRSTMLDEYFSLPGGPVPMDLRSHNEFESFRNAHFPVDALRQPTILEFKSRLADPVYAGPSDRQSTETHPSIACSLVPLQSEQNFRLLELLPGHGGAPLAARLVEANAESSYEALSGVWDDISSNSVNIPISTGTNVTVATISLNLAAALTTLRYPEHSRTLWIDILCINQSNVIEKSAQMTRIGDIFRDAKILCVWLGPVSRNSHLAFELITQCTDLGRFEELIQHPGVIPYWDAFTDLMRKPWFRRRWAILEICHAKDALMHCGSLNVGWKQFKQTVLLVTTKYHDLGRHARSANERLMESVHDVSQLDANRFIQLADKTVRKSGEGNVWQYFWPLESMVFNCAWLECRDPRDMVYALLGLARARGSGTRRGISMLQVAADASFPTRLSEEAYTSESARDSNGGAERHEVSDTSNLRPSTFGAIEIDYAKSIFEVCSEFSLYTLIHSRSLDLICRPWAPQGQNLPSWMPTVSGNSYVIGKDAFYRRARADPLVGNSTLNGLTTYSAALDTEPMYHYDAIVTPRELRLSGFVCGGILAKKPSAAAGIVPASWFDDKEFLNKTENAEESFCRTLVADRGPASPYPPPSYYALAWNSVSEQRTSGSDLNTTEFRGAVKQNSMVDEFLARVQSVVWGRRLLLIGVGDRKLLALGPENTKKRDLICILYGCSVPVVLRKVDDGRTRSSGVQYQLIGDCYVDGMMNGEAFDVKGVTKESFTLV